MASEDLEQSLRRQIAALEALVEAAAAARCDWRITLALRASLRYARLALTRGGRSPARGPCGLKPVA